MKPGTLQIPMKDEVGTWKPTGIPNGDVEKSVKLIWTEGKSNRIGFIAGPNNTCLQCL